MRIKRYVEIEMAIAVREIRVFKRQIVFEDS